LRERRDARSFGLDGRRARACPRSRGFVLGRGVAAVPVRLRAATRQGRSRSRPLSGGRQRRLGPISAWRRRATAPRSSRFRRDRRARVDSCPRPRGARRRPPRSSRATKHAQQWDRPSSVRGLGPGSFIVELHDAHGGGAPRATGTSSPAHRRRGGPHRPHGSCATTDQDSRPRRGALTHPTRDGDPSARPLRARVHRRRVTMRAATLTIEPLRGDAGPVRPRVPERDKRG